MAAASEFRTIGQHRPGYGTKQRGRRCPDCGHGGATWVFKVVREPSRRAVPQDAIYGQSSPLPEGDVMVRVAGVGEAVCWRGSVLAVLHQLAVRELGRRYRWEEGDAGRFVLTGDAPPMPAIEGKVSVTIGGAHNTIRLTVRPYVSPVLVAQFYRALQAGFDLRPRRPTSERNLNILAFVSDVINREGKRPTWRALMDRWNAGHPDAQYTENRIFYRDYERAHRVIWAERYGVSGWRFRPENVGKQHRKRRKGMRGRSRNRRRPSRERPATSEPGR